MHCLEIKLKDAHHDNFILDIRSYIAGHESTPLSVYSTFTYSTHDKQKLNEFYFSPAQYGCYLGKLFFSDTLKKLFNQALGNRKSPVKFILSIEAESVKALLWEYLCAPIDSDSEWSFLALHQKIIMVYGVYSQQPPYSPIPLRKINALVLIANPASNNDYNLAHFNEQLSVQMLQRGLATQFCLLGQTSSAHALPSLHNLEQKLSKDRYHVLHIMAHGLYKNGDFCLYLLDEKGEVQPYLMQDIIDRLRRLKFLPALIFLAVCHSGQHTPEQVTVAEKLIQSLGTVFVISMSERVLIDDANQIAENFYREFFKHGHPEIALNKAKVGLQHINKGFIPILFTRQLWGNLFYKKQEIKKKRYFMRKSIPIILGFLLVIVFNLLSSKMVVTSLVEDIERNPIKLLSHINKYSNNNTSMGNYTIDSINQWEEIEGKIKELLYKKPKSADYAFKSAFNSLNSQGDINPTLQLFAVSRTHGKSAEYFELLGDLAFLSFRYRLSIDFYQKAYSLNKNKSYYFETGINYYELGLYKQACYAFYQLVKPNKAQSNNSPVLLPTELDRTIHIYQYLGLCEQEQGNFDKALKHYEKALINAESQQKNSLAIAKITNNIGMLHYWQDNFITAIEHFNKAIEISTKTNQPNKECYIGQFWLNLSKVQAVTEYNNSIASSLYTALDYYQNCYQTQHPETVLVLNELANYYQKMNDSQQAANYLVKAMSLTSQFFLAPHPFIADSFHTAGAIFLANDRYDDALNCYQNALQIDNQLYGEKHYKTAMSYLNLGITYYRKRQFIQAIDSLQTTHSIFQKNFGDEYSLTKLSIDYLHQVKDKQLNQDQYNGSNNVVSNQTNIELEQALDLIQCHT